MPNIENQSNIKKGYPKLNLYIIFLTKKQQRSMESLRRQRTLKLGIKQWSLKMVIMFRNNKRTQQQIMQRKMVQQSKSRFKERKLDNRRRLNYILRLFIKWIILEQHFQIIKRQNRKLCKKQILQFFEKAYE
ncbi:hypothetical protein IMG5_002590 [Ichthyophthirius multifiliis]|uniref:Uncharacterized protein n=1 Tax=Ichthyophthirius multifiliis TaxID=5932 RepID=G0QJ54_ICHMU|nr:hypothetical protein IMG5_002590 [Ichthyophthirius multifiliis]EGR34751.1 hypothetical protein IMG5_002590 [Ichthyophthirius multifiliis]|eukprot:XP_004040055.1 hypothetical protein IMG5_002590 [Ichthyophthirius multifiliis]